MRAGPQKRGAVAEKAGTGGDHPEQQDDGRGRGAERDPETPASDQLLRIGGLGDGQSVASKQLDERIEIVALGKRGEALLELWKGRFDGANGAAARQAAERQRQPSRDGGGENQNQRPPSGSYTFL